MAGASIMFGMAQKVVTGIAKVITFGAKEGVKTTKVSYNPRLTPEQVERKLEMMREYTNALPGEHNLSQVWIRNLIKAGKTPELKTIIAYLKSKSADNIPVFDRATLIQECLKKIDLLKTMSEFLH